MKANLPATGIRHLIRHALADTRTHNGLSSRVSPVIWTCYLWKHHRYFIPDSGDLGNLHDLTQAQGSNKNALLYGQQLSEIACSRVAGAVQSFCGNAQWVRKLSDSADSHPCTQSVLAVAETHWFKIAPAWYPAFGHWFFSSFDIQELHSTSLSTQTEMSTCFVPFCRRQAPSAGHFLAQFLSSCPIFSSSQRWTDLHPCHPARKCSLETVHFLSNYCLIMS